MMIPFLINLGVIVALFGAGCVAGFLCARLRDRRQHEADSVLVIKPPRAYVDEDGRSDFRPELREAADRRRLQREAEVSR